MTTPTREPNVIRVAHSPDSDDAFMFWALAHDRVNTEGLTFEHTLTDIETLNHQAMEGVYELTAISYHAYAMVHHRYALLNVGSSVGNQYGPVVIAREPMTQESLKGCTVAVPGRWTTACLALQLWQPEVCMVEVPFDQIMERVASGEFQAGVIIHEGQLLYAQQGLSKVVDLGEWWFEDCNLPLPLGGNAVRLDLGDDLIRKIGRVLKRSVEYGLQHREEALDYALGFARGLDRQTADRFVGMYVNDMTLNADAEIRKAIKLLLWRGYGQGVLSEKIEPHFIDIDAPEAAPFGA